MYVLNKICIEWGNVMLNKTHVITSFAAGISGFSRWRPAVAAALVGGCLTLCAAQSNAMFKTVKIGNQVWMAENLNVKTANSWCYDNDESNCKKYGRLYTWDAARSACPAGWHLPTRGEWKELALYAGGDRVAGKKLKAKSGWRKNGNGTDDFGFSALPGGQWDSGDDFEYIDIDGEWWTATGLGSRYAYSRKMDYDNSKLDEDDDKKSNGLSVRCVSSP
jgi:uncharacterized protein (TIGR02145 family)